MDPILRLAGTTQLQNAPFSAGQPAGLLAWLRAPQLYPSEAGMSPALERWHIFVCSRSRRCPPALEGLLTGSVFVNRNWDAAFCRQTVCSRVAVNVIVCGDGATATSVISSVISIHDGARQTSGNGRPGCPSPANTFFLLSFSFLRTAVAGVSVTERVALCHSTSIWIARVDLPRPYHFARIEKRKPTSPCCQCTTSRLCGGRRGGRRRAPGATGCPAHPNAAFCLWCVWPALRSCPVPWKHQAGTGTLLPISGFLLRTRTRAGLNAFETDN